MIINVLDAVAMIMVGYFAEVAKGNNVFVSNFGVKAYLAVVVVGQLMVLIYSP